MMNEYKHYSGTPCPLKIIKRYNIRNICLAYNNKILKSSYIGKHEFLFIGNIMYSL